MTSFVQVLLLAGVGVVFFVILFGFVARSKKKDINTTKEEEQRAKSFAKGASGKDD